MWDLGLKDHLNLMKMEKQKQSTSSIVRRLNAKPAGIFSRRKDPDRAGRLTRRRLHCRLVPQAWHPRKQLLQLEQRFSGGWQEAPERGYRTQCFHFRGKGPEGRKHPAQRPGSRAFDPGAGA
jgi:hypothetical protein